MNTVAQALTYARYRLSRQLKDVYSALEAELLLAQILGRTREYVHAHPESKLDPEQQLQFNQLLSRRLQGEPVAYLLGHKEFWSLRFKVTPATLIPRPETELMVEKVLDLLPRPAASRIADLGTGSGAIAIALAYERKNWQLVATDKSAQALEIAQENAAYHGLKNIEFRLGAWCAPLGEDQFDAILSNPPYLCSADPKLECELRYEPVDALASGKFGLTAITEIITTAAKNLKPDGWLLIEHDYEQKEAVEKLAQRHGFNYCECMRDLAGLPRISVLQKISSDPA